MPTRCQNCPLRQKDCFIPMSREELAFMQRFKTGELMVEPGTQILVEGTTNPQLFTALHGLGLRYKMLPDGQRQVVNFVLPGDFLGLQAGLMKEVRHTVESVTPMTLCVFARAELWDMFRHQPDRAYDLTWLAAQEEHFLGEALTTVGQRVGLERLAWAFLKLYQRGEQLGLCREGYMHFPFTQTDIADALGLSQVHTNRLLRTLRERDILHWRNDKLVIADRDRLVRLTQSPEEYPDRRPLF